MSTHKEEMELKDEIKKEFQVERMILFSDAVFAIVITLMAIEVKFPETAEKLTSAMLLHELRHVLPVILAYLVSFLFIGTIWYQHLKIFSIVTDYDGGLVIRNLVLLFLVGLFPFTASMVTRTHSTPFAFVLYLGMIMLCSTAQFVLHHYIVKQRPALRTIKNMEKQLSELRKKKIILIGFAIIFFPMAAGYYFLEEETAKSLLPLLMLPVVIVYRYLTRQKKKKLPVQQPSQNS